MVIHIVSIIQRVCGSLAIILGLLFGAAMRAT
jgi:hypothetical protein